MHDRWARWRVGFVAIGLGIVLAAAVAVAWLPMAQGRPRRAKLELDRHSKATVQRTSLDVRLRAGGEVSSSRRTIVECEVEPMAVSGGGGAMSTQGRLTILEVIPNGSRVKKGDVLCRLDASEYTELLRQQTINVKLAEADAHAAQLDLEVAQSAVLEYTEGTVRQSLETFAGDVAMAEMERTRLLDRWNWSRRMLTKGYVPASQVKSEGFQFERATLALDNARLAMQVFQRFGVPKMQRILQSEVYAQQYALSYRKGLLAAEQEQSRRLQQQVELCTVRAPHDGLAVYADKPSEDVFIEPGRIVKFKQDLFYLPDLRRMEVATLLHQSVVDKVRPGMPASISVEGFPDESFEGRVASIEQIPATDWWTQQRYFVGHVQIEKFKRELLPGMTAEVRIGTARRPDVLVVPAEAVTIDQGREICYVATEEGVERRPVLVGEATFDLLEVTSGLQEGEEVVLDPTHVDLDPQMILDRTSQEPVPIAVPAPRVASAR
jgi:HlyD family secretion protein